MVLQLGNEFSVDAGNTATLRLSEILLHPEYNGETSWSNDIALIKLSAPADPRFHWPACLPAQGADYTGQMSWMYAWGESSLVPLVLDNACSSAEASTNVGDDESRFTEDDMLCVGGTSGGQVCSVEHGGPLMVEVDGHYVV